MTRIRRGGYLFMTWAGDHPPKHVHVYVDGEFVLKWDLYEWTPIVGVPGSRLIRLLNELRAEGRL
jgi:hypothetical protein